MKVLITGATGQVGRALLSTAPAGAAITATGSAALDIGDTDAVARCVQSIGPDLIINAAAYTAVDRAETEEAAAHRVNAQAVGTLAACARGMGARLVHISTDFVFDGRQTTPYAPGDAPNPLGAYGRTKLAGEAAAGDDALIVRTAWVYAASGANFVATMLRLMAERDTVRVVADQIGTPSWATGLARALWSLAADQGRTGIYHYTDSGVASWYDFAVAIQEEALANGLLARAVPIIPIATADYPTAARRPAYSVLDTRTTIAALGAPPPHWRTQLRHMLHELKAAT